MHHNLTSWERQALRILNQHEKFAPAPADMRAGAAGLVRKGLAERVPGSFCAYRITDAGRVEFERRDKKGRV